MTNGTIIPVERLASLYELTAGKVRHEQGVYNMGFTPCPGGYRGIFRNCTRNARHLLGWPSMAEGEYQNVLYEILLDEKFRLKGLRPLDTFGKIIHDVRIHHEGSKIGCEKVSETEYHPVGLRFDPHFRLLATRITSRPAKNWNYLGKGYDCGTQNGQMTRLNGAGSIVVPNHSIDLRGSAPAFHIGDRLITTYHAVFPNHEGKRSYWHYFAELEPQWPHAIRRLSFPFKFSHGGDPGRIQFLMSVFPDPQDKKKLIVSFGESDADNCIGRIKTADVIGMLL